MFLAGSTTPRVIASPPFILLEYDKIPSFLLTSHYQVFDKIKITSRQPIENSRMGSAVSKRSTAARPGLHKARGSTADGIDRSLPTEGGKAGESRSVQ
ncbi:hypothetical protein CEXT_608481 [Caerostris extrusa]|uniref:Uncharacterized protein n=1 Tax=Caerostris extrusa TaxID=172846 RepID=A0AAV4R4D8_CAEEX|nr:hypothetical protein CEXT_608481 [Caerostris extrusa]